MESKTNPAAHAWILWDTGTPPVTPARVAWRMGRIYANARKDTFLIQIWADAPSSASRLHTRSKASRRSRNSACARGGTCGRRGHACSNVPRSSSLWSLWEMQNVRVFSPLSGTNLPKSVNALFSHFSILKTPFSANATNFTTLTQPPMSVSPTAKTSPTPSREMIQSLLTPPSANVKRASILHDTTCPDPGRWLKGVWEIAAGLKTVCMGLWGWLTASAKREQLGKMKHASWIVLK